MTEYIVIRGRAAISALGASRQAVRSAYERGANTLRPFDSVAGTVAVAQLGQTDEDSLRAFVAHDRILGRLDRSVQLAVYACADALCAARWNNDIPVGIFVGSSRGATGVWEMAHERFIREGSGAVLPRTSPITTAGNLSTSIARFFHMEGIHVSHSITCSTALHAILNGVAWLRSRLVDRVLVGGTEAPLTDFTVAQMKALGIYSERDAATWPCRPFSLDSSENSFVLGEGAAVFCMERVSETDLRADDLIIRGVGFSTELAASGTGITVDGEVFQRTMTQAIASANVSVDLVLAHAAGTSKGDAAELAAIEAVCTSQPNILSTKYLTGHSFGASGALQVDLACHFLEGMALQALPYASRLPEREQRLSNMRNVLVNATGFGGNAVSLVIGKLY